MLKYLKNILTGETPEVEKDKKNLSKVDDEKRLQIATCALFVEIAKADSEFTDKERDKILSIMKELFDLKEEHVNELLELSEQKSDESVSLYDFTPIINEKFTKDERYELVKNLWRLIYVDDSLDKYEDYLIKQIGSILQLEHRDIIAAKLQIKDEMNNS